MTGHDQRPVRRRRDVCYGRLFLKNIGGMLVREEDGIHGYCEECRRPITFKTGASARRLCRRRKEE